MEWLQTGVVTRVIPDLIQIWPDFAGFLMKQMVATMSAAIKRQYSSVLHLLHPCLPVFGEICGTTMDFVFFRPVIKIVNAPVERSLALVL